MTVIFELLIALKKPSVFFKDHGLEQSPEQESLLSTQEKFSILDSSDKVRGERNEGMCRVPS